MIGPLFDLLPRRPVTRPTGSREVDAPCGCRLRLRRSWDGGELASTVKACEVKAAGKSCGAVRGVWE